MIHMFCLLKIIQLITYLPSKFFRDEIIFSCFIALGSGGDRSESAIDFTANIYLKRRQRELRVKE